MGKGPNRSFIEGRQPKKKKKRKYVYLIALYMPNRLARLLKLMSTQPGVGMGHHTLTPCVVGLPFDPAVPWH